MELTWLKHYPPGIPAEVDVNEFNSLVEVLKRSCERFGELPSSAAPRTSTLPPTRCSSEIDSGRPDARAICSTKSNSASSAS